MKTTDRLSAAEAELRRLAASPKSEHTQRRVLELQVIVAEHRVGNTTTVFP